MDNCYQGTNVPPTTTPPCGGEFIYTDCITTPTALTALGIEVNGTQTDINLATQDAFLTKESQIQELTDEIEPFIQRKVFRGTFLGSTIPTVAEDTINNITISNINTGIYELTSVSFTISTNVSITPNAISAGYDEITVSYDYSNILAGRILFVIKNNGVLINLHESPIKIEI